jgi:lysozyme
LPNQIFRIPVILLIVLIFFNFLTYPTRATGTNSLVIFTPGSAEAPGDIINTITPIFKWHRVESAEKYALYISKYPYGPENLVYTNEEISGDLDCFELPPDILYWGMRYRWNMKFYLSTGWSDVSNTLYFRTQLIKSVKGIDVSHYQNEETFRKTGKDINWTRVHIEGYNFVFVKATEGTGEGVGNIIAELPLSTEVKILENKENGIFSDGYYWWYVNVTSGGHEGKIGWIAHIALPSEFKVGDKIEVKATVRLRSSPTVGYNDGYFKGNVENARKAGMLVGAYHFARPDLIVRLVDGGYVSDAVAEAKHFLSIARDYLKPGYLRPVLDVEVKESGEKLGRDGLSQWIHEWMNTIREEIGVEPILYTSSAYAYEYLNVSLKKYPLWIAHYTYNPDMYPWTPLWNCWDFWQWTNESIVPGIEGYVDENLFNGDLRRLYTTFRMTFPLNVDVVLVIDRSGSMGDMMGGKTKMQGAKEAAIGAVNTLLTGDKVGVVSFSDFATQNVHLTSDFNYAIREIEKLSEGGWTSFGAGLSLALQEFETNGRKDSPWAILFLSDGWHNTAPDPEPYVAKCKTLGIPIYTIGLGNTPADVNEYLLKWMAEETGGKYLFAPSLYDLQNIFIRFSLEATGYKISAEFSGIVFEGQIVTAGTFEVKPNTERIRITLNWPGSDLDLIIIRPDGKEVDLTADPDIIYSGSVAKPEWVILIAPQTGIWTVKVYGKEITSPEEQFIVWISTYEAPPLPKIDKTPPTTTLTIGEPKYGNTITYVTPETAFVLSATDNVNGTGVAKTAYRIYNSTYSSNWLIYLAPFYLTNLTDGAYNIDYNSTDNAGNIEPTNTTTVILFSWNYIFKDSFRRNTTLKINIAHQFFQFMTPDKDYGIRNATYLRLSGRTITIKHYDNELRLIAMALDTKLDFCLTIAWDLKTRTRYFLIDKIGIED